MDQRFALATVRRGAAASNAAIRLLHEGVSSRGLVPPYKAITGKRVETCVMAKQ